MLHHIHSAITNLLREGAGLPPAEVDISFEMPTAERAASLTRPTLGLFLFDVEENTDLRQGAMELVRVDDLGSAQRMPPRRYDLRYLVSAIATDAADEHQLLWGALRVLLRHSPLPLATLPAPLLGTLVRYAPRQVARLRPELLAALDPDGAGAAPLAAEWLDAPLRACLADPERPPANLRDLLRDNPRAVPDAKEHPADQISLRAYLEARAMPLAARVGREAADPRPHELWGGLDLPPRPALVYIVTAPVDLEIQGPVWGTITSGDTRPRVLGKDAPASSVLRGVVRDRAGAPLPDVLVEAPAPGRRALSDGFGRYSLALPTPGVYTLRLSRPGGQSIETALDTAADSHDLELG